MLLHEFPGYTLETIQRADITTLTNIVEVRRAEQAIELFNQGSSGRDQLAERPDMLRILLAMAQAQQGDQATIDDVYADLTAAHPEEDDDE